MINLELLILLPSPPEFGITGVQTVAGGDTGHGTIVVGDSHTFSGQRRPRLIVFQQHFRSKGQPSL